MRLSALLLFAGSLFAQGPTLPGMTKSKVCTEHFSETSRSEHPVTATIRRKVLVRDGYLATAKGMIIDHIIPVELGGSNALANLQAQTKAEAHRKDLVENALHRIVCNSGDLSLSQAQLIIANDWKAAYIVYVK